MIEQTLLIIKPNSVMDKNVGNILKSIEDTGFDIVILAMFKMTADFAETFYCAHKRKHFFSHLVKFMTTERCIAAVLEKDNAIEDLRLLAGDTDPNVAKPGTLRQLYGLDVTRNAVHSSDSPQNAVREINLISNYLKNI